LRFAHEVLWRGEDEVAAAAQVVARDRLGVLLGGGRPAAVAAQLSKATAVECPVGLRRADRGAALEGVVADEQGDPGLREPMGVRSSEVETRGDVVARVRVGGELAVDPVGWIDPQPRVLAGGDRYAAGRHWSAQVSKDCWSRTGIARRRR